MVFVLDKHKHPLMPCSPKRARLLLMRKRAVVHRVTPFAIRLKDRRVQESELQPLVLKVDPGSQTTGMALARVEQTGEGEVHHAVHLAAIRHRGQQVHTALLKRAHVDGGGVRACVIASPASRIGPERLGGSHPPCARVSRTCSPGPGDIAAGHR